MSGERDILNAQPLLAIYFGLRKSRGGRLPGGQNCFGHARASRDFRGFRPEPESLFAPFNFRHIGPKEMCSDLVRLLLQFFNRDQYSRSPNSRRATPERANAILHNRSVTVNDG